MGPVKILACLISGAMLQACLFGIGDTDKKGPYSYRGHFQVSTPNASPWLNPDSDLRIVWKTNSLRASGHVSIHLQSDSGDLVLASDILDTGSFLADIRGRKLPATEKFRAKIVDSEDESIFDFSSDFGISPPPEFRLHFLKPESGSILEFGEICTIRVDIPLGKSVPLSVSLFKNESLVAGISDPTSDTAIFWIVPNDIGTGNHYRFKAQCNTPFCRYEGWSPAFSIASPYSGSFDIASPVATDTLPAGGMDTVFWTRNGNPGNARISGLYLEGALVYPLEGESSRKGDSEYVSWKIPPRMMSSSRYRIGIVSVSDPGIPESFSDEFTIAGVAADAFEYDDDSASARPLSPGGAPQEHTLHYGDKDWMRIESGQGKSHALLLKSSDPILVEARDRSGLLHNLASGAKAVILGPDDTGMRFVGVSAHGAGSDSPAGAAYSISLRELDFDSMGVFAAFSDPISGKEQVAGAPSAISWSPDTEIFGPNLKLDLFRDTTLIQVISGGAPNSGSFLWETNAWLMTANRYRIRMSNADDALIQGFSPMFAILGKAPDPFEPDDTESLAGEILPDGGIQMRSLTVSDTDWVAFDCAEGGFYGVRIESVFTVSLEVFSSASHFTGGTGPQVSRVPGNGRCRIRVTGGADASVGDYGLSVSTEANP